MDAGSGDAPTGDIGSIQLVGDNGRPIDLLEEEAQGGHTIAKHVGKSEAFLFNRLETEIYRIGPVSVGLQRAGSFPSLEAANKLVNSTIAENSDIVAKVASGELPSARVEKDFGSKTGYEAYKRNDRAQAYIRDTSSVGAFITHDSDSPRGYRVITAFPMRRD